MIKNDLMLIKGENDSEIRNFYKKRFFKRVAEALNGIAGEDIYSLLPPKMLDLIYENRSHSIRIISHSEDFSDTLPLHEVKRFINVLLNKNKVKVSHNGYEMSLHEFFGIGLSLIVLSRNLPNEIFFGAERIRQVLKNSFDNEIYYNEASKQLNRLFMNFSFLLNDLNKYMFWFNFKVRPSEQNNKTIQMVINIYAYFTHVSNFMINGHYRTAFQVGWGLSDMGMDWIRIKSSSLELKSNFPDSPLNVYIQTQALKSISNHLGSSITGITHYFIYLSLKELKFLYTPNNSLLIEYRIYGKKVGYFEAILLCKSILIRSFIFITQDGTPEGRLLKRNIVNDKVPIDSIAIDKLETFMNPELKNNKQLRHLFVKSNCSQLLELYKDKSYLFFENPNHNTVLNMYRYLSREEIVMDRELRRSMDSVVGNY